MSEPTKKPTILIVDDDPLNVQILAEFLESTYRIKVARNGIDALEIAERCQPDLILLDIMMPDIDGFEVCRRLKKNSVTNKITIIFVTAKNTKIDEELGLTLGAVDYISKPFVLAIVKARIQNHILLKKRAELIEVLDDLIIERQKTEEAKNELQQQLFQAQKMETIGQLTGGIAHDFNNILMSILGFTRLALTASQQYEDSQNKEKIISYLENVEIASNRATDLISKMLIFCRESGTVKATVAICPVMILEETLHLLHSTITSNISIVGNLDKNATTNIVIHATELQQVITNLVINARDAIQNTGRKNGLITVELSFSSQYSGRCSACSEKLEGSFVVISVSDNGEGIDAKKISRVFDPFFTTKEQGKGTGLGLSMVSGIVHNVEGHISVESTIGKGTCFNLLFPLAQIDTDKITKILRSYIQTHKASQKLKICVVDDEISICELLKAGLSDFGYEVETFTSSLAALEHFKQSPKYFDAIITHNGMPDLTGLD